MYVEHLLLLFAFGVAMLCFGAYFIAFKLFKAPAGKLIGFLIVTVLLSPVWYPGLTVFLEGSIWNAARTESSKLCNSESRNGPIAIDSLVDETGGLRSGDIAHLLTSVKLSSIDIKLGLKGVADGGDDWSPASMQHTYAHLELGDKDSPNCFYPLERDKKEFFTEQPPVKPGTCLQISYLDNPLGKYVVREIRTGWANQFSTWVLEDRESKNTLARVTDAFRVATKTQQIPFWDRRTNASRCENGVSGYSLLLNRIEASKDAVIDSRRWNLTSSAVVIEEIPEALDQIGQMSEGGLLKTLKSTDRPFGGDFKELHEWPIWSDSYAAATKYGAWLFYSELAVPSRGEIVRVNSERLGIRKWGTTGTQLVTVRQGPSNQLTILGADFEGQFLWRARVAPLTPWIASTVLNFEPVKFELVRSAFLIHGVYGHSIGEENKKAWTISIPLAELSALEAAGRAQARPKALIN
ncbi:hypothetical protein HZ993_20190 [Rhodoferax sp. AJA081-3]|uniref:hypothetical protein n=1 Tax=Rhodoferax sp. AJA081-3 TaxID=2752316 RepID=UPI001AE063CF|nr:hypothetical protein [Rhodoferax sp. AJA081-3]QTN27560.1 hypothetical protein HZ993_20190 [Rhodoferax sp. AJA081-3]